MLEFQLQAMISNAFPLAEHAPTSNPVSKDQATPGTALANLNYCLPNTAFGHSVGNRVAGIFSTDHVVGLPGETKNLAGWGLDGQLRWFFTPRSRS